MPDVISNNVVFVLIDITPPPNIPVDCVMGKMSKSSHSLFPKPSDVKTCPLVPLSVGNEYDSLIFKADAFNCFTYKSPRFKVVISLTVVGFGVTFSIKYCFFVVEFFEKTSI